MKTVQYLFIASFIIVIMCICSFMTGYYYHKPEPIIKEVIVTKNIDRIVYRDYSKADCCELLYKYDTSPMSIKYNVNKMTSEYTSLNLSWSLHERSGLQEINVPVHESGNWKLYAGIGIGAVAVGGLVYMLK